MEKTGIWEKCIKFRYIENQVSTRMFKFYKNNNFIMITSTIVGNIILNCKLYDHITTGDILCYIIYLGVTYQVKAEWDAAIDYVFCQDGRAVDYNYPLFLIEIRTN